MKNHPTVEKFIAWYQTLSPKGQKRVKIGGAIASVYVLAFTWGGIMSLFPKRETVAAKPAPKPPPTKLLDHEHGYSILKDGDCLVYKGLTEGHMRLEGASNIWDFKKMVKARTGATCVLVQ